MRPKTEGGPADQRRARKAWLETLPVAVRLTDVRIPPVTGRRVKLFTMQRPTGYPVDVLLPGTWLYVRPVTLETAKLILNQIDEFWSNAVARLGSGAALFRRA